MYVCRYILGSGVTGVVGRLSKIQLPGQVIRTSKSSEPSIIHVYIYTHCIYIYMLYMMHILYYYMHFYFAILLYNLHNLILYIHVLIFPTTYIYISIYIYIYMYIYIYVCRTGL